MQENSKKSPISIRLKQARELSGLSQGQAAKLLGFHRPTISEIESGNRKVSTDELVMFSKIYKISIDWLLETEDDEQKIDDDLKLAAREFKNMKKEDIEKIIRILKALKVGKDE